jgi:ubiquinone/menaquinone biosynthesis C-methylase UbiE
MSLDDVNHFNKWAKTYDKSFMQRLFFGPIQSKMLSIIDKEYSGKEPPRIILDIGCGTGRLLRAAALRWPKAKLFGADPAEQMIAEAKRLNPNATFKISAAESLPFSDHTFDLVVSSLSFHHWADQAKGLQEIARVLRPGGCFCLADHTLPLACLLRETVKNRKQIRELINNAGLSVAIQRRDWKRFVLITLAKK